LALSDALAPRLDVMTNVLMGRLIDHLAIGLILRLFTRQERLAPGQIHEQDGRTVIANLHTLDTARNYCDQVIGMRDREIVFDGPSTSITAISNTANASPLLAVAG
jgi:ABC-type phosphate/phosphonate transport system ATPase subunit